MCLLYPFPFLFPLKRRAVNKLLYSVELRKDACVEYSTYSSFVPDVDVYLHILQSDDDTFEDGPWQLWLLATS